MAIIGLTVGEHGEVMQRLAVTTKVSIGEIIKQNGKTYPGKLDHFAFLRKSGTLEWEPDPTLTKHFTENCREFAVIFLDDQIDNVFKTELAWWSAADKKCWGEGNGQTATRKTAEHPEGQDWTPCGDTCPDLKAKRCGPSGDLYFILADFPRLGSVCRLHTKGKRSIQQIYSALEQIRTVNGGRLAGIYCKLVVRPEKSSFIDKDGKRKSTTIYALNIELSADDMRSLIGKMTENAQLFEQTRKLLGSGRKVEYVVEEETDAERAPDITAEFYPTEEATNGNGEAETAQPAVEAQQVRQPERKSATVERAALPAQAQSPAQAPARTNGNVDYITPAQRKNFFELVTEGGWGTEQVKEILKVEFAIENSSKIPANRFLDVCARFKHAEEPESTLPLGYEATNDDIPF